MLLLLFGIMAPALALQPITILNTPPTSSEFHDVYFSTPLLVKNLDSENAMRCENWTLRAIHERFSNVDFRHGAAPYPIITKPLSLDEEENEVFQFGTLPATFSLGLEDCLPPYGMKYGFTTYIHESSHVACSLLQGVIIPQFVRHRAPLIPLGGLIIGKTGATTDKHQHFAAINILLHGEKYWEIDGYAPFLQRAGEVVYIPEQVDHYVRNTRPSIAWTFQFHENHFGTEIGIPETEAILYSLLQH